MDEFWIIVYSEDYDLGVGMVVKNDTLLMDIYKELFAKLRIPLPENKVAIFSAKDQWRCAGHNKLKDLGDFHDKDMIFLSLWDQYFE